MRKIKALYDQLNDHSTFDHRYPDIDLRDGKVHVLYVSPCLNATGYYRMIAPALELNGTDSHSAIVSSIHKWDFNKRFWDYDSPIDERLITWADYVVLPPMLSDATYFFEALRAKNKRLQLVMDLDDFNVHALPKEHLDYAKITHKQKKQLLANMVQMNIITGGSEGILEYYDRLIAKYYTKSDVFTEYLPSMISSFGYQGLEIPQRNKTEKIRIGIMGTGATAYDTLSIRDVLKVVTDNYADKVELVLFGWNGKLPNDQSPLRDIPFIYEKLVGFFDYFDRLNALKLDMALLPMKKILFNTHGRSFVSYLEPAVFGIPAIASDLPPYREVIQDKETGYLVRSAEEWLEVIDELVSSPALRTQIGKHALREVWQTFGYTDHNLEWYRDVFI